MHKIQSVSLFFRVIFQILLVVLPLMLILAWVVAPEPLKCLGGLIDISVIPRPYTNMHIQGMLILHTLTVTEKLFGFMVSLIPLVVQLVVLYFLIRLFRSYERGDIFSLKNVYSIRNIGYTLLIGQLLNPLYEFLMGIVLTLNNPGGQYYVAVKLDQTNFGVVLTALLIVIVSWVMAEGYKLQEEQQLTI